MMKFPATIRDMETNVLQEKGSFYEPTYTLEEVADLISLKMEEGVEDELTAVRIAIRRTLLKMEAELDAAEFAIMAALIFKGSSTVAHLLRTRRAISGQAADGLLGAIAQAIQELGIERDWKI